MRIEWTVAGLIAVAALSGGMASRAQPGPAATLSGPAAAADPVAGLHGPAVDDRVQRQVKRGGRNRIGGRRGELRQITHHEGPGIGNPETPDEKPATNAQLR